jgi:hypothetical protein
MKKLNLDLEHLEVETFDVLPDAPGGAGTVAGHEDTDNSCQVSCPDRTCTACPQNTMCICEPVYYSEASCLDACDPNWTTGCGVSPNYTFSCYGTCGQWTCAPECTVG